MAAPMLDDPANLVLVALTLALAGLVKGVIGMGLPTVSLAVLTATLGLHAAMAVMIVPSFVTNLWQAISGGHTRAALARTGVFLAAATCTVWLGARALTRVDVAGLAALLGVLLVVYGVLGLARVQLTIRAPVERWAGPLAGTLNGVLTGMTGSFVVPGVLYLQALGMPRDMLIQAMGMLFTASTLALALSLGGLRLLDAQTTAVSSAAVVPALLGMVLGRRLRRRLSEERFRVVFFACVALIGTFIVLRTRWA